MLDGKQRDKLLAAISSFYKFRIEEESDEAFIMIVENFSAYPEEHFTRFVNKIGTLGFVAFTGPDGSERVYLVNKKIEKGRSRLLKGILIIASIITIIYTGFAYQISYSGNTSIAQGLPTVVVLFLLPLGIIVIAREAGRFVGLRLNGMEYHLPVLVPDPLGMGVLGSIAGHEQAYVSRRAMFYSGLFPLVAGFIASLSIILVGTELHFPGSSLIAPVNSSFKSVSLPLAYTILFGKLSPISVTINIMQYAGWIGLTMNALNAFPIGFLDGGLIAKSLTGNYSKYVSYAAIVGLFALCFIYTPWFVLLLFVILIGINGPEPLLSTSKLSINTRVLTAVAMLIFIVSIVPVPYHVIPNNIGVNVNQHSEVLVNGTGTSAEFYFTVSNLGSTSVVPSFTMSPSAQFSVSHKVGAIAPGSLASYEIQIPQSSMPGLGMHNFTVSVYSGVSKDNTRISVMMVNLTNQMSFNDAIPYRIHRNVSGTVFLNFSYTALTPQNFSMMSFAEDSFNYSVTVYNLTFQESGYSVPFTKLFTILPGQVLTIKLTGGSNITSWNVIILSKDYNAAIAYITLGG